MILMDNEIRRSRSLSEELLESIATGKRLDEFQHLANILQSLILLLDSPTISTAARLRLLESLRKAAPHSRFFEKEAFTSRRLNSSVQENKGKANRSVPPGPLRDQWSPLSRPPSRNNSPFSCLSSSPISNASTYDALSHSPTCLYCPPTLITLWFTALRICLNSNDTEAVLRACRYVGEAFEVSSRRNSVTEAKNSFQLFLSSCIEAEVIERLIELLGHPLAQLRVIALDTLASVMKATVSS